MTISFKVHSALDAAEFVRRGGVWEPDIHIVVPVGDEIEAQFVQSVLDKYASHVETYAIGPCLDADTFSVELQFQDKAIAGQCRAEYRRGFGKGGVVPKAKQTRPQKAKKRLHKHRMYQLQDGELFWYYAKWDNHGNLVGKIYDPQDDRLHNKVIHRSVLEQAELVQKGDEPWKPC